MTTCLSHFCLIFSCINKICLYCIYLSNKQILVDATATVTHWIFITVVVITKHLSAKYDIHINYFLFAHIYFQYRLSLYKKSYELVVDRLSSATTFFALFWLVSLVYWTHVWIQWTWNILVPPKHPLISQI